MNRLAMILLRNLGKLPGAYSKLCRYAKNPDAFPETERWEHIAHIMKLAVGASNVTLEVTGTEHIPREGGFMLYGNHQGMFDVVAIAVSSPRPLGCVYKKEIHSVPLLKQVYACTNSFAMDREDARQSLTVIQKVTQEVKNGRAYLIFPEGTRSKQRNIMGSFHAGSFRCAIKAKCPVVPFALVDSFRVLDEKGSAPLRVQLHYLPPIPYEEYQGMKTTELAQLVKDRIQQAINAATSSL